MGVERLLLEAEAQGVEFTKNDSVKIYFAGMSEAANEKIAKLEGIGCETDLMNRSFKAQMKYAGKSGIPYLAVIGDDELASGKVNIKKMDDGSQTEIAIDEIKDFLKR